MTSEGSSSPEIHYTALEREGEYGWRTGWQNSGTGELGWVSEKLNQSQRMFLVS